MRRRTGGGRRPAVPPVGARSWWLEEALRADPGEPCPALAGDVTADVCVVGGGFAGLWTAYELHERDPARRRPPRGRRRRRRRQRRQRRLLLAVVDAALQPVRVARGGGRGRLRRRPRRHGRRARRAGSRGTTPASTPGTRASCTPGPATWQPGPDDETFRLLEKHGYADRLRRVDAAEARRVADSPRFVGGVVTPDLTVLQPGKLARELRARAARARRAHLRGHADGPRRGRPAAARGHAGRRRQRRRRGAHARRVGGAGAALPPRLRRVHRLHGRHRADPELLERSAGPPTWASPTCARCSTTCAAPPTTASPSAAAPWASSGRPHPRPGAHGAAAGGGRRARPDLAVPAARGRALRRRLERAHGHHRHGPARSSRPRRAASSTPASASPATASRAPGSAARSWLRWCSGPTTSGAACRSSVRRSRSSPPEPLRWPLVQSTSLGLRGQRPARTSRAGAPACCRARSSPPTAGTPR